MSAIYTTSAILVFILMILIRKTEEKLDIIKTIVITLIAQLSINALVCYLLNLINIPLSLLSLSIVNYLISAILLIIVCKTRKTQKYVFKKTSLIILIVFIILSVSLFLWLYKDNNKLRYLTGDPQNHYTAVRFFIKDDVLSNKGYYVSPSFMFMGYTNEGIIGKVLYPYLETVSLINIYLVFEAVYYALAGIVFAFLVTSYAKKKYQTIIAIVFSVLYVLAYPLHSWIAGFHYLTIGLIYITTILYVLNLDKIGFKYKVILMMLLNFGIIFSYCMFCPFVYLAEFLYFIYKYNKESRKKLAIITLFGLIIPGIMGTSYVLMAQFKEITSAIVDEGYVYKNLWSNMIMLLPFGIYNVYHSIKKDKITIDVMMFFIAIGFIAILFMAMQFEKCSEYYFFKTYYALWIIISAINVKGIIDYFENNKQKYLPIIYIVVYLIVFTLNICLIETPLSFELHDGLENTMELYTFNKTALNQMAPILTDGEYDLILKMEDIIDHKWDDYKIDDILFITEKIPEIWVRCLTGFQNTTLNALEKRQNKYQVTIDKIKQNTYKYMVITYNTEAADIYQRFIDQDLYETIYESEFGKILKKK